MLFLGLIDKFLLLIYLLSLEAKKKTNTEFEWKVERAFRETLK
jgi:hypothetical protein